MPLLLEEVTQSAAINRMSTPFATLKGTKREQWITPLHQEAAKLEGAQLVGALVRTSIRRERAARSPALRAERRSWYRSWQRDHFATYG